MSTLSRAKEILAQLISFATVSRDSNLELIHWVADYMGQHGVQATILADPAMPKANLFATIGPAGQAGVILSGHSDVVPVDGQKWTSDPFVLSEQDGRFYGRGTSDMKGFIALVLAHVPNWTRSTLASPIHIALSYDEEVGCSGVGSLIDHVRTLSPAPRLCLVGEPTSMQVVSAHKGICTLESRIRGKAGHSSNPAGGANALSAMARFITLVEETHARLTGQTRDESFDPPVTTLNFGTLSGGAAINIIAEEAVLGWEMRPLPGVDLDAILAEIDARAMAELLPDLQASAGPDGAITTTVTARAPALPRGANAAAEDWVMKLLGANTHTTAAFTTEAGHFQTNAGVPAIVCGPGSIEQAHKPDEFITHDQLGQGDRFLSILTDRLLA